jgi:hypothetical protein
VIQDPRMHCEEALGVSHRLESSHCSFSLAGGLVRVFRPVVQSPRVPYLRLQVAPVVARRHVVTHWRATQESARLFRNRYALIRRMNGTGGYRCASFDPRLSNRLDPRKQPNERLKRAALARCAERNECVLKVRFPRCLMSGRGVRRDKAALSSGCKSHPA